jgi:hypothetical protein
MKFFPTPMIGMQVKELGTRITFREPRDPRPLPIDRSLQRGQPKQIPLEKLLEASLLRRESPRLYRHIQTEDQLTGQQDLLLVAFNKATILASQGLGCCRQLGRDA